MANLDTPIAIRKVAMDLLAMREHGRVELKRKLVRKGAQAEFIDEVLDQLTADKLLCENRYLESYIRSRANAGYGPVRIREELAQRGIEKTAIQIALNEAEQDWQENLHSLWQRKFKHPPQDPKERAKHGRFLVYRGFSMSAVSELLNSVFKS